MKIDALTADELDTIRARHRPAITEERGRVVPVCAACEQGWPCDAAWLLDAHEALVASRDLAREHLYGQDAALAACEAERDGLHERLAAAECRLPTQGGGELVLTAVELWRAHQEARELYERAQAWAAAWKRAATRRRADHEGLVRLTARAGLCLGESAAMVEAARGVAAGVPRILRNDYLRAWRALDAALAAYDAALRER